MSLPRSFAKSVGLKNANETAFIRQWRDWLVSQIGQWSGAPVEKIVGPTTHQKINELAGEPPELRRKECSDQFQKIIIFIEPAY